MEGLNLEGLNIEELNKILGVAIFNYIKDNPGVDSVDIVSHFKLRNDITLNVIGKLKENNKIERRHIFGLTYGYFIIE